LNLLDNKVRFYLVDRSMFRHTKYGSILHAHMAKATARVAAAEAARVEAPANNTKESAAHVPVAIAFAPFKISWVNSTALSLVLSSASAGWQTAIYGTVARVKAVLSAFNTQATLLLVAQRVPSAHHLSGVVVPSIAHNF
jgi:hypothetical protein